MKQLSTIILMCLLTVMQAVTEERLADCEVVFRRDASACCVILASKGYPGSYEKGYPIEIPDELADYVYVAGAAVKEGRVVTNGGRVLGVVAVEPTLQEAVKTAYARAARIHFDNKYCRSDIGARALAAKGE